MSILTLIQDYLQDEVQQEPDWWQIGNTFAIGNDDTGYRVATLAEIDYDCEVLVFDFGTFELSGGWSYWQWRGIALIDEVA